jgi:hypothetical protein
MTAPSAGEAYDEYISDPAEMLAVRKVLDADRKDEAA